MVGHRIKSLYRNILMRYMGVWEYFLYTQKIIAKRYRQVHYKDKESADKYPEAVICMVNGWGWSGGLVDRLKGAVSVYDWCVRCNKPFKLHFVEPFVLQKYLIPNTVDWTIDEKDICYTSKEVNVQCFICDPILVRVRQKGRDLNPLYGEWEQFYLSSNKRQTHVFTNLLYHENDFHTLFNQLFKPSERLEQEILHQLELINGRFISVSFRFSSLLGDFKDCTGAFLPEKERYAYIEDCIKAIFEIAKKAPKHDRILVTADSRRFIEAVKNIDCIYTIPGEIGHVDYNHSDEVYMKTFLDFMLISKAEAVYQVVKRQMYGGLFSRTAAMVGNKPFEVYEC